MSDAGKLLTVAEAADLSACSTKTLRRAIDAGQLKVCRLGQSAKSDRVHPNDLSAWWAQSRYVVPQFSFPDPTGRSVPHESADDRLAGLLGVALSGAKPSSRKTAAATATGKKASSRKAPSR